MLIVLKGLPGSGKSTVRQQIVNDIAEHNFYINSTYGATHNHFLYGYTVLSADDTLIKNYKGYHWTPIRAKESHDEIQYTFQNLVGQTKNNHFFILDNQNVKWADFKYYVDLVACDSFKHTIKIVEPSTLWKFDAETLFAKNTHNVPLETIRRNLGRWQDKEQIISIFNRNYPLFKDMLEYQENGFYW